MLRNIEIHQRRDKSEGNFSLESKDFSSTMENPQARSRVVIPVDDRISNLPDSLICHILSFLPTKLVVATSVLSRKWKFLWAEVSTLDFNDRKSYDRGNNEVAHKWMSFVQFVNRVLIHHNAQCLKKFRLTWREGCDEVYVNMWVSYAIARNLGVLDLQIHLPDTSNHSRTRLVLPGTIFTCGTLEFLRLCGSILVKVPSVVYLPKLEVLNLSSVYYESDECVHKLMSGCPLLHSLTIHCPDNVLVYKISSPSLRCLVICDVAVIELPETDAEFEIDAPALESLVLRGHVWNEYSVKRLTSVNEVDLHFDPDCDPDDPDNALGLYTDRCNAAVKLIQALNRVNYLTLNGSFVKALSNATTPLSSACFGRLTKLDIECECCEWSSLNVLLACSIKLQVLNITMDPDCHQDTHKDCWKDPKFVPKCLLFSLKQVSFSEFEGSEDQMAMIRYILEHGAVLNAINLQPATHTRDLESKFLMLQKIAMFPRCSGTCRIKFD